MASPHEFLNPFVCFICQLDPLGDDPGILLGRPVDHAKSLDGWYVALGAPSVELFCPECAKARGFNRETEPDN